MIALLVGVATATDPLMMTPDEAAGYLAGGLAGEQVDCKEFYAYGAGAGCVNGCIGCVGMAGAAYMVDPHAWDPLSAEAPDARFPDHFPQTPASVSDEQAWREGYEQGWDEAVQKTRARNALVGGSVPMAMWAGAAGLYVLAVFTLVAL